MTLSPDEQPLTRRQLRELEKQMPRKERLDAVKAAEEADAARRAAAQNEGATNPATTTSADVPAGAEPAAAEEAAAEETAAEETAAEEAPAEEAAEAGEETPEASADTESDETPEAESADEGDGDADPAPASDSSGDAAGTEVVEDAVVVEEPASPFAPRSANGTRPAWATPATASSDADGQGETPAEPVVEGLIIDDVPVDDDPDDEETEITIEPAPSGPILAPVFQAPVAPAPREEPSVPATTDDSNASFDDLISSRGVGSTNSSTTSALVLPAVPNSTDMGTALDETGEVIITGSIDLPSSMGASGAPAAGIESNDLDALLERGESENVDGDVAPVSASRAVSTNGSASALVTPPKRGRVNAPVILAVTAGVLAIGVVGLLVAAFVFHAF